jgi:hypothetical protein
MVWLPCRTNEPRTIDPADHATPCCGIDGIVNVRMLFQGSNGMAHRCVHLKNGAGSSARFFALN